MTERTIEYMPLSGINGAEVNPKDHDIGTLSQSVRRFGYAEAMLLDERTQRLVAGHGRLETLRALKSRGKKPPEGVDVRNGEWFVPVQRGWASKNDTDARAYVIASNKISEEGGWNQAELEAELEALADEGAAALAGVGFDLDDVDALLAPESRKTGGSSRGASKGTGTVFQVLIDVESETAKRSYSSGWRQRGSNAAL